MTRRILCAIDVNQPQIEEHVLEDAIIQARTCDAHLDILSVLPDYGTSFVGSFFSAEHHREAIDEAKRLLDALVEKKLGAEPDLVVRKIIGTGVAYEQILKTAETTECGLIVLGAHKPNFQDYLLGPNSARVVRHAKCSVYIVRQ
ncbi:MULTISPECIES: universal stress protein [unclassified Pseudovibrio]|uniref:universal stress protein n=1 Tax=unclassified Pseudovibrio TaxID=2627060 RepID=UPI0007AEDF7B|nr:MULTISPECIES: universal stress protein [unclassified Pseudovibrio]KZK98008.1 Universal stress protein F [Pseudovibrio sp. W74]KZL05306.1 Universal stress protein F [Pseudovibrio sp. Ad14]